MKQKDCLPWLWQGHGCVLRQHSWAEVSGLNPGEAS